MLSACYLVVTLMDLEGGDWLTRRTCGTCCSPRDSCVPQSMGDRPHPGRCKDKNDWLTTSHLQWSLLGVIQALC